MSLPCNSHQVTNTRRFYLSNHSAVDGIDGLHEAEVLP
jgi:hypothetical protein